MRRRNFIAFLGAAIDLDGDEILRVSSRREDGDMLKRRRGSETELYPGSGPVITGRDGSALHADHDPT